MTDSSRSTGVVAAGLVLMAMLVVASAVPIQSAVDSASSSVSPDVGVPAGDLAQVQLLQSVNLVYDGAFRVPSAADLNYDHSGHGLTFNPSRDSLFVSNYASRVSEITIPTPSKAASVSSLPRAAMVQGPTDVLRGRLRQAGDMIGGLLVDGSDLIVSVYTLYDASNSQRRSHFRVPADFQQSSVVGPVRIGPPGFVAGPMTRIPFSWQARLGGPALSGLCCVSIISRSSHGPSAAVFDPAEITSDGAAVGSTRVLSNPAAHPSLGEWNSSGMLWNNASTMGGMVWVDGTSTVLYVGRYGKNFCYGSGAACADPSSPHQGDDAYPYDYFVWVYDANDLVAVKQGQKEQWDVMPYATWTFNMPFVTLHRTLRGVAYDPTTQRIFLAEQQVHGPSVVVRVLSVRTQIKRRRLD